MSNIAKKLMGISSAGASGESYWINLLGGTGSDVAYGVAVDSSDNIIMVGSTTSDGAGNEDFLIAKYTPSGTLLWDKTLGGAASDVGIAVAIDSSDNIVVLGYTASDGVGANDFLIAKYTPSGTLLWDKTLGTSGADAAFGVAIDSSDNIVVVGYSILSFVANLIVAKYDPSGTPLWDRTLRGTNADVALGVTTDSSDNILIVGYTQSDGAGSQDLLLAKYDPSGTLLWDRTLGGTLSEIGRGVAIDSSGNIVVVGQVQSDGAGGLDFLIAKYNPSGTLLWDKTLGNAGTQNAQAVVIDSSDNIIVVGYYEITVNVNSNIIVAKYNSSGTLLWDKTLGGIGIDFGQGVTIDSSDNIIVAGSTTSNGSGLRDCLVAKLPPDGSGDGVYGGFTYQDAIFIDADAVLTSADAVLTSSGVSLTNADAVLTSADAVLTSEFFEITP